MWSSSNRSIIKIETINIYECFHNHYHKKAGAPEGAPRPKVETVGGAKNKKPK